ncbi:CHAT domain-containing protein [Paractinoplanes toevensis]|uniref:CHAT domain-containing protein n=1 Tax=Paractinoplanes toevensis TaxID=571911 RepID=A0A919T4W3_9ACTN|nr:CHAT domain-containing protein [Actinoplanes toevensis]GIM88717.1 hypothetical protein Ato02nite_005100 [Actinoplanes toevensis]
MTEAGTTSAPTLDDNATRLLAALDGMPVRMNDRDRLVRAFDVLCSTEWTRVIVRLTSAEIASLRRPDLLFTPHELTHVVEVARTLAGSYAFESTSTAHIAVALALTTRWSPNVEKAKLVAVIAEAFGLGGLNDISEVVNRHLTRVSVPRSDDGGGAPSPSIYRTDRGDRLHLAAVRAHVAARGIAVVVLIGAAATGDSGWAWPVALLPLVSARDPDEPKYMVGDEVSPPGQIPTRWPLPGGWAILAAALGLPVAPAVFVILAVVLAVITAGGEALTAREHRFAGARPGAIGPAIARLASLSESFETTRRGVRIALALTVAIPLAVSAAATTTVWPLYFLAALLIPRRSSLWATAALTVAVLLDGFGWMVPLTVLAGFAARITIGYLMRPPELAVPLPARTRRDRQARRLLRTDRPVAAVRLLEPGTSPLLAWALLAAGHPGDAKAAARNLPAQSRHLHGLITCLAELELANVPAAAAALEALEPLGDARRDRALREQLLIADARVRVRLGQQAGLAELIAGRIPATPRRRTLLAAAEQVRLVAEARLHADPALSWYLGAIAFDLMRLARADRPMRFFTHLHKERNLDLGTVRAAALIERAELRAGWTEHPGVDLQGFDNAASFLLRMDRPMEAAAQLDDVADHQVTPLHRLDALNNRIEALAALHWARHHLQNLEERRLWWRTVNTSFEKAMTQAVAGQDWATLAELIESARLQLSPLDDESSGGRTAPYIRVRGVSRIEEAAWYRPGERPDTYTVEDMARFTLGPGTWWWSTWSVTDRIFWALVPPDGPVTGGVLACGPGSAVAATLADLRAAVPIRYPGEQDDSFRSRVFGGALCGPARAEADLARRLGDLIPPDLRDVIVDEPRTRIAVAPAHVLANVPWPVIVVVRHGKSARLIDRCQMVIAPPAALLGAIALRDRASGDAPLGLAVLDPGGDEAPPHAQLRALRDLGDMLPGVRTVGHTDVVDLDGFDAILQNTPAESSAVFACHTHPGDGSPLSRGLVVRPATKADPRPVILSAADLINAPSRHPVPRQALLLACDSADLGQAAEGEWLVLGPAMLWAGADRVIVTTFDTPDLNVVDRQLVQHLLDGHDMVESLRAVQATPLRGLSEPDKRLAHPLFWAGYVAMGAFGDPATMTSRRSSRTRYASKSAVELVEDAAEGAALVGRSTVLPRDLVLALALYGYEEDLTIGRLLAIRAVAYPWTLLRHARNRIKRRPPTPGVTLGPEVTALLNAAAEVADGARHRVVDTEHVLAAVLAAAGPTSSAARLVSGLDGRQPEVVKELIADTQDGFKDFNRPAIRALTTPAAADVYTALGARPPETDDAGSVLLRDLG